MAGQERPTLNDQIRAEPIPEGLFWMEDNALLKYRTSSYITAVVAFLAKDRKEGGVFYLPLLIGWQTRPQGRPAFLDERVRQHVVKFQTMLQLGTAPYAEDGGILDYHAGEREVPRGTE